MTALLVLLTKICYSSYELMAQRVKLNVSNFLLVISGLNLGERLGLVPVPKVEFVDGGHHQDAVRGVERQ